MIDADVGINQPIGVRDDHAYEKDACAMKPLRILHMTPALTAGGMERRMGLIAKGIAERGNAVHVAYLNKGDYAEDIELDGVTQHPLKAASNYDMRLFFRLLSLTKQVKPDLIQTWSAQMDILGGIIAYLTKTRWIMMEPISPISMASYTQLTWKDRLRQYLARRATVVSNSLSGNEYWRDKGTFRSEVIRNGQQVRRILDTPAYDKSQLPVSNGEVILCHIGRLNTTATAQKNFQTCLEAVSNLSSHIPPVKLLVCGDGDERKFWERKVMAAGLENKVTFLGYLKREDVWGMMKIADALISISFFEGCPNVVQEAMLCRCPLIVSDIPEHRELLTDDEVLLVDPHSSNDVSRAVEILLSDKNSTAERAWRACEKASSWTVEHMLDQYEQLYHEISETTEAK